MSQIDFFPKNPYMCPENFVATYSLFLLGHLSTFFYPKSIAFFDRKLSLEKLIKGPLQQACGVLGDRFFPKNASSWMNQVRQLARTCTSISSKWVIGAQGSVGPPSPFYTSVGGCQVINYSYATWESWNTKFEIKKRLISFWWQWLLSCILTRYSVACATNTKPWSALWPG